MTPSAKTIETILKETKIYQILRPKCVNGPPTMSLAEAIRLMQEEKSGYVVIRDEHLHVVGMFTERDVLMKVLGKKTPLSEPVSKYMNTETVTMSKDDTVGNALDAMFRYSVRHVPLVDEHDQMNGVLSIRTIVHFLAELLPTEVLNLPPKADQTFHSVEGG